MESGRFRQLLDTPGPFASIYFEDSADTHDVGAQLGLTWRALRGHLEDQGVDESVTAEIEHAVMDLRPPAGRRGRAVVAGATGVVLNEYLLRPTADTVVRISDLPYIVPILEHGFEQPDRLLAVIDHTGADLTAQRAIEASFLRQRLSVIDAAADRFTAEVGRRSGLAAEGLDAVCSALREGAVEMLIIGDIDDATVVVDEGLTTIAPNANMLSEHGAAPAKTLRADEVLPILAISAGASLVRTDERIAPADGVAAVLRYAPSV